MLGSGLGDFGAGRLLQGRWVKALSALSLSAASHHRKESTLSNKPAYKVRLGLITATVWKNESVYSVDIVRSYKSASGDWNSTSSYGHSDLLNVAKCSERAEIWISRQLNGAK